MSTRKKAATPENELASLIIEKAQEQVATLASRNWPEIKRIMEKDNGDIALTFKVQITDRPATPGEQADKDSRQKVTLSFAEKFSDSVESDLPDPSQPDLPVNGGESVIE